MATGIGPIIPSAIRSTPFLGFLGSLLSGESWDLVNGSYGTAEVWTLTTGSATNSTTYTVTLKDENGVAVTTASYTSDGSASTAEISAGLLAAIKANALFGAYGSAVATTSLINTFTANKKGRAFSLTSSSGDVVAAQSVAAAAGSSIGLGLGVVRIPSGSTGSGTTTQGSQLGALPYGILAAKVGTATMAYAANTVYTLRIVLYPSQQNPIVYEVTTKANTDLATTKTALIDAANAALPANSVVVAAADTSTFTCTAEIAGLDFDVVCVVSSGTGTLAFAWDTETVNTKLDKMFGGITVRRADVQSTSLTDPSASYPPGRAMAAAIDDAFVVVDDQGASINFRDPIYLGVGSSNSGGIYFTSGANKVRLDPKRAWVERQADGRAVVFVDYI